MRNKLCFSLLLYVCNLSVLIHVSIHVASIFQFSRHSWLLKSCYFSFLLWLVPSYPFIHGMCIPEPYSGVLSAVLRLGSISGRVSPRPFLRTTRITTGLPKRPEIEPNLRQTLGKGIVDSSAAISVKSGLCACIVPQPCDLPCLTSSTPAICASWSVTVHTLPPPFFLFLFCFVFFRALFFGLFPLR